MACFIESENRFCSCSIGNGKVKAQQMNLICRNTMKRL
uniref:Uncharacterized protein n=1 Tax=Anopheles dirus TaxID=7168 RepID=A0A182NYW2_9DIPT